MRLQVGKEMTIVLDGVVLVDGGWRTDHNSSEVKTSVIRSVRGNGGSDGGYWGQS